MKQCEKLFSFDRRTDFCAGTMTLPNLKRYKYEDGEAPEEEPVLKSDYMYVFPVCSKASS